MNFEFSTLFQPLPLGVLLVLCLGVFGGLSIAFLYHWRKYGMHTRLIKLAPPLYLAISAAFCSLAVISYLALLW